MQNSLNRARGALAFLNQRKSNRLVALLVPMFLIACENAVSPIDDPNTPEMSSDNIGKPEGSFFGGDGIDVFGLFGPGGSKGSQSGGGIGVNSYLWRASLDTLAFMPLSSADPFGGVIITDWYTPPETPDDRFKMTVYIIGRQLRADGIRVALFRQNRSGGQWSDAKVEKHTATKLENEILTRARQLRVAARTSTN